MFLYMRVKGEVEAAIKGLNLPGLTIYQPGLIANRDGDSRIGETIGGWIPFIPKIQGVDLGRAILLNTVAKCLNNTPEETLSMTNIKAILN